VSDGNPVFILDSFALLTYLDGVGGSERVQEVLEDASQGHCRAVISLVNLGEVMFITEREVGLIQAQSVLAVIDQLPIEILPVTQESVLAAAHIKANFKLSYAGAFAAAAAQDLSGILLTGDPEFASLSKLFALEWLVDNRRKA
jgi:predicted nucleic acid-binding protein